MAITTTTISKSVGWSRTDVILQLEEAFSWLGWHGDTVSGQVIGFSSMTGGGKISNTGNIYYQDVFPISTTGIGTGASFYLRRSNGDIYEINVNRPGYGYTGGEIVTLSAEDIGGSINGATDLQIKVAINASVSGAVSYAVTFTNQYQSAGTDRNGLVSGQGATITIKEGDTLTINNYQSSSAYDINILWRADNTTGAGDTNRVFNVINQNNDGTNGEQTIWTPLPGQAGTYYVRDNSTGAYVGLPPTIIVQPANAGDITPVGVGSITRFYDKDLGSTLYPWGTLRHPIEPEKRFGDTYRVFQPQSDTQLRFHVGSAFHPSDLELWNYSGSSMYPNRLAGEERFDIPISPNNSYRFNATGDYMYSMYQHQTTYANSTSYQLDLNIFRSSIDPNFAVFSYRHPGLSSLRLRDNTYATFFLHNFTTNVWDLDYLFLGGITFISPTTNENDPFILFDTKCGGEVVNGAYSYDPCLRCAESGYIQYNPNAGYYRSSPYKTTYYRPNSYPSSGGDTSVGLYYRDNSGSSPRGRGGSSTAYQYLESETNYNAVIKGIPLNVMLSPCPYYIPDDFVLLEIDYPAPSANIQQGDTITISGSEIYTVITGSYNQTERTRGILFCARTV